MSFDFLIFINDKIKDTPTGASTNPKNFNLNMQVVAADGGFQRKLNVD